jgi:hypothetical protein
VRKSSPFLGVALIFCFSGCGTSGNAERSNQSANPTPLHKYVSPMHRFTVMAPKDPAIASGRDYRFFPSDPKVIEPLVEIDVGGYPAWYRPGTPPESSLAPIEQAYKAEPGAVVEARPITLQGVSGREFAITAGPRAPGIKRFYFLDRFMYTIEFNPNVPGASEMADSFEFQSDSQ